MKAKAGAADHFEQINESWADLLNKQSPGPNRTARQLAGFTATKQLTFDGGVNALSLCGGILPFRSNASTNYGQFVSSKTKIFDKDRVYANTSYPISIVADMTQPTCCSALFPKAEMEGVALPGKRKPDWRPEIVCGRSSSSGTSPTIPSLTTSSWPRTRACPVRANGGGRAGASRRMTGRARSAGSGRW
jgi:hypothetical protein